MSKRISKKLSKRKAERRMATTPTFEKAWEVVATKCEQIHHEEGIIPYLWISEVFNKVELVNMHDNKTYAVHKIKVRGNGNE